MNDIVLVSYYSDGSGKPDVRILKDVDISEALKALADFVDEHPGARIDIFVEEEQVASVG